MKKGKWEEFLPNVGMDVMSKDLPEWSKTREPNPFEHYSPWPAIALVSALMLVGFGIWGGLLYGVIRLLK